MGARVLSKWQAGIESTRGTAVAATRVLGADIKAVPKDRVWENVKYADGHRVEFSHKRLDELLVRDSISFTNGYYQALPMIFQCSLDGTITPAEVTANQGDYRWDVDPSGTAANDPDSLTLEMGDDTQAYEVEYVMFENIRYAGQIAQEGGASPVTVEAAYFGRQITPTTFTAGQSLHTGLVPMNAKLARLYMDTSWASLGNTEQTSLLRGFEVEIITGVHPKFFGSANKYFSTHGEDRIGVMITLLLEGAAGADTIFDLFQAGTERAVRLDIPGPQIGTGATYMLRTDVYGYWKDVVPLSEESNGNNLHAAIFRGLKDSSGNFLSVEVTTNHNTI